MARLFILFFIVGFGASKIHAQLGNGSPAPDFTVTDINGNGFSLYSEMSGGKSACLDFSATWCGPCWNFHQSHVLNQVNANLSGYTSVLFIEADTKTNTNCLYGTTGCVGGTQGDWVTGTTYPIADITATNGGGIPLSYNISYYPTLYVISPDFRTWEIQYRTYQEYYDWIVYSFSLAATANVVNSPCGDNGSITLDVTGGLNTKTYKWSNNATTKNLTNLPGGTYTVTITDAQGYFKAFGPYTVAGPQRRVAITSSSQTDIKCFGNNTGAINVSASYGTPPYTYLWSNGETNANLTKITAGTYTITITDAASCTVSKTFKITEPNLLVAQLMGLNEKCDNGDGFISVFASGGVSPYIYTLGNQKNNSGTFSKLKTGTYSIQIQDVNKCTVDESIFIDATHKPKLIITSPYAITCKQDTIVIDGQLSENGAEFIYNWTSRNGKIIGDPYNVLIKTAKSGTYQLKISNTLNQCYSIDSVVMKEDKKYPDIKTEGKGILNCIENSLDLVGSTSVNVSILYWTKLNSNLKVNGKELLVNVDGDYVFNVKDTINECISKDTVKILSDMAIPNISIENPSILNCKLLNQELDGSSSEHSTTIFPQWFTSNGHINSGENSYKPVIDAPGTYVLRLKNTRNGCESIQATQVQQNIELANVDLNNLSDLSCIRKSLVFDFPQLDESKYDIHWSTINGHFIGSNNTNKAELDQQGDYQLYYKNKTSYCEETKNFNIKAQEKLTSNFDFSKNGLELQFTNLTSGIIGYQEWNFGDGSTSTETNPLHKFSSEADYEVCLTTENECGPSKICKNISLINSGILNLSTWDIHPVSCFGGFDGSIKLNVQGGTPPYTYLWNTNETTSQIKNLMKGIYSVSITDANKAEITKTFTVGEPTQLSLISANIKAESTGFKNGRIEVKIIGGIPTYTYKWSNGSSSEILDQLESGFYSLTLTDANGCQAVFGPFEVKSVTSVGDISNIETFELLPNPFTTEGNIHIKLKTKSQFQLNIYTMDGTLIKHWVLNAKEWSSNMEDLQLNSGIYLVQLDDSSVKMMRKWVKMD